MINPLASKLASFTELSAEERQFIDHISSNVVTYSAKSNLIKEGDRPERVFLLLEGWACRYKILADGKRQIMAYLLPGDLCDVHIFILKSMDHSMSVLSEAKVALISKEAIIEITERWPNLARALWWSTLVDEGVLREWIANMGQRDAFTRIAHLFAELYVRLDTIDQVTGRSFEVHITQEELGDTMGLTSVHVNRMLQRMRDEGLISLDRNKLHVPDIDRLMRVSGFETNYLHLNRRAGVSKPAIRLD